MEVKLVTLVLAVCATALAKPHHHYKTVVAGGAVGVPSDLFTFDGGNVGVNFLGFKASAGLGGILTGNAADGGLHAEAGTPFGQAAGAGIGGTVAEGNAKGYKYHYASDGHTLIGALHQAIKF